MTAAHDPPADRADRRGSPHSRPCSLRQSSSRAGPPGASRARTGTRSMRTCRRRAARAPGTSPRGSARCPCCTRQSPSTARARCRPAARSAPPAMPRARAPSHPRAPCLPAAAGEARVGARAASARCARAQPEAARICGPCVLLAVSVGPTAAWPSQGSTVRCNAEVCGGHRVRVCSAAAASARPAEAVTARMQCRRNLTQLPAHAHHVAANGTPCGTSGGAARSCAQRMARLREQQVVRQHQVGGPADVTVRGVLQGPEAVIGAADPAAEHRHVRCVIDAVHPDGGADLHAARAVRLAVPQPCCAAHQQAHTLLRSPGLSPLALDATRICSDCHCQSQGAPPQPRSSTLADLVPRPCGGGMHASAVKPAQPVLVQQAARPGVR